MKWLIAIAVVAPLLVAGCAGAPAYNALHDLAHTLADVILGPGVVPKGIPSESK